MSPCACSVGWGPCSSSTHSLLLPGRGRSRGHGKPKMFVPGVFHCVPAAGWEGKSWTTLPCLWAALRETCPRGRGMERERWGDGTGLRRRWNRSEEGRGAMRGWNWTDEMKQEPWADGTDEGMGREQWGQGMGATRWSRTDEAMEQEWWGEGNGTDEEMRREQWGEGTGVMRGVEWENNMERERWGARTGLMRERVELVPKVPLSQAVAVPGSSRTLPWAA